MGQKKQETGGHLKWKDPSSFFFSIRDGLKMVARSLALSDCCFNGIFMQMRWFRLHLVYRNETCFMAASPETFSEIL